MLPCIGHRANPTDNPEKMGGFSASFRYTYYANNNNNNNNDEMILYDMI